jgi:hypothetical protein
MPSKKLAALLISASLLSFSAPALRAEEGMWLPDTVNKLPLEKMRAKGFALTPEEVFSNTAPSLKDAIVIVGGGTGEFISPEGLLLTNHHVAFEGIAAASTPEKDYVANGFAAKNRGEELPTRGYSAQVLVEARDVTREVLAGVNPGMSAEERAKAIDAKRRALIEAENAKKLPGRTAQVVEMLSGLQYYLYSYDVFRDVRMVYAPPKNIGFYGGDPDNFEWPRHCGDFTFFRVYANKDNQPAEYSTENVPYKPKKFLTISLNGYKEGDFTMVMGYPGRTNRYREASSVEFNEKIQMPFTVDYFEGQIDILRAAGKGNRALELELASQVFGLSNTMKAFQGGIRTMRRSRFLEQRRAEEAAFARYIESSPDLKAKYGDVIPKLNALNAEISRHAVADRLTSGLAQGVTPVLSVATFAVAYALEREKPADQRNPRFSEQTAARVKPAAAQVFQNRHVDIEQKVLRLHFQLSDAQPAERRSSLIEKAFTGKSGAEREAAQIELAKRLAESPAYDSPEKLTKLFDASAAELRASNDPAIKFLIELAAEIGAVGKRTEAYNAEVTRLRALYIEGFTASKKAFVYPDANRTLRFTYGEVKGYAPYDGANYKYFTTLSGVAEKDTGRDPFDAPPALLELVKKRDFGSYVDPQFGDVPVDFLSTNDIIGGNSGSPILNGKGEMIGIVFDGNYEGLGNDFLFNPDLGRTISVDVRYVLFLAEKMAGVGYLFSELKFSGKAAGAR